MNRARNSKTGKIIQAIDLTNDPSYANFKKEIWYADPDLIENANEEKYPNKNKIPVYYRKECERSNKRGENYIVSPNFALYPKTKKYIKIKNESQTHKKCKDFIYNYLNKQKIKLYYSQNQKEKNYVDLKLFAYNKLNTEEIILNGISKQITDVFLPLKKYHPVLGNGIVIEIQLSPQNNEETMERSFNYAAKGYSVIWIFPKDFTHYDKYEPYKWHKAEPFLFLNKQEMEINTCFSLNKQMMKNSVENINLITQNFGRQIDEKIDQFIKLTIEIDNKIQISGFLEKLECPNCTKKTLFFDTFRSKKGNNIESVRCWNCDFFQYFSKFMSNKKRE